MRGYPRRDPSRIPPPSYRDPGEGYPNQLTREPTHSHNLEGFRLGPTYSLPPYIQSRVAEWHRNVLPPSDAEIAQVREMLIAWADRDHDIQMEDINAEFSPDSPIPFLPSNPLVQFNPIPPMPPYIKKNG